MEVIREDINVRGLHPARVTRKSDAIFLWPGNKGAFLEFFSEFTERRRNPLPQARFHAQFSATKGRTSLKSLAQDVAKRRSGASLPTVMLGFGKKGQ